MKILISDGLAEEGLAILQSVQDLDVDSRKGIEPEELMQIIGEYHALIVRSATKVTAEVIGAGQNLKVIGRAGVGIDNIDVPAATRQGVIVMNAPEGNTISAAELTIAHLLALSRHLYQFANLLKSGTWDRSRYVGRELNGKTLGVVGLGRIGSEVAKRAFALGMRIVTYDPYASPELADRLDVELGTLDQVLEQADVITVHCPLLDSTRHLISDVEFAKMKDGVRVLNCARGGIIDEDALIRALESGKVAGCSLDVFEEEPAANHPLLKFENVIATPHIGAVTLEAQQGVAVQIARQVVEALHGEPARNAVNLPRMDQEVLKKLGAYIHLAERIGRFLVQIAPGPLSQVYVTYTGEMNDHDVRPITAALIKGILEPVLNRPLNLVNAHMIARERGIKIVEAKSSFSQDFSNVITLDTRVGDESLSCVGTIFGNREPRIVRLNDYPMDAVPEGHMIVVTNDDQPGVIRHISTILDDYQINIANMNVGRDAPGGRACTVVNIDTPLPPEGLDRIAGKDFIRNVKQIFLD